MDLKELKGWQKTIHEYRFALRELETKVMILNTEWKLQDGYSPIEHVKVRLKEPESIINKLKRKNLTVTEENLVEHIQDIAGMRIVCAFVKDIYRIIDHLKLRSDLRIVQIKDYIAAPKPNGYQSVHLIVQVPLILSDGTHWVYAEIQLRTMAMDFWASLEHILYYKFDKRVPPHVQQELTDAAKAAYELDEKMLELRREIIQFSEQEERSVV